MPIQTFRDLVAWQLAMRVAVASYRVTEKLPRREMYGLTAQIRRCATSVPSNIAEGRGRKFTKEFVRFVAIAQGSLAELETQLQLAIELDYLSVDDTKDLNVLIAEVGRVLHGLRTSLERKVAV